MKSNALVIPATLVAAGAFASPALAVTVDYTATPGVATSINIVGDSTAEYLFRGGSTSLTANTLEGKVLSGNTVGAVSATPYFPTATSAGQLKNQNVVTDGYYGLFFTAATAGEPVPAAGGLAPTQYSGYALVDRGGTHISQIEFQSVSAAVPEPESWALMLLGFGAAGAALRQRRRTLAAVTAA